MSRRQTLTNDILFGSTAPAEDQREQAAPPPPPPVVSGPSSTGSAAALLLADRPSPTEPVDDAVVQDETDLGEDAESTADRAARRRPVAAGDRRPSGRERHDEKITVYLSADELDGIDLAQLDLRRRFGIRVDRGRIVREAVAVLLADLDARGEGSTVVKRLSGRR